MTPTARKPWQSAIAEFTPDGINVRGYDVLNDLVGRIDFGEMVYLLLTGELPKGQEGRMINAVFVAVADHGISPSSTVTRFVQAAGVPIQCSVAAGVMMFGDIHGGAGQELARNVQALVAEAKSSARSFDEVAQDFVAAHKRIDGFGHPQHPEGDPRTRILFELADAYGVAGDHIAMTRALEQALARRARRPIPANIDSAIGAIALDLGLDWRLARALLVIPRTAGLFAHAHEEMTREPGWRQVPMDQIGYDGPPPRQP
ncbi:citryl-CoA lyase [Ramlibacter sp. AW1]|uniref:citrate synthase (unknown stereospecificity) n=1 Tax=Ramlibacter aurantiacus TaxID=2801330 RepID=A0A936ZQS5_9BURK|nr:citryl-CoA lyase [Ramlibacter aurantiacus]MBL0419310.1 citryl-CoA lyase [Ramlibacter aurantiacus]